jgi:hypothetical protein
MILLHLIMRTEHPSLSSPVGFLSQRNKGDVVGDRAADGEEVRKFYLS